MGSEIYPGIFVTGLKNSVKVTAEALKAFFAKNCKVNPDDVTVELFTGERFRKARIMGIKRPYDEIRLVIANAKLDGRHVNIQTPDFGVPRDRLGEMSHPMFRLHNLLKEAHGYGPVLRILHPEFVQDFGGYNNVKATVTFADYLDNVNKLVLPTVGRYLHGQQNHDTRFPTCDLTFVTILEALQAVTFLNKTSALDTKCKSFLTTDDNKPCRFTNNFGLGVDGRLLDVAECMKIHGYIPFSELDTRLICKKKVERLTVTCIRCRENTTHVGIHPNLVWLATKCNCNYKSMGVQWHKEDFMRSSLTRNKMKVDKIEKRTYFRASDSVIPLTPGCLPQYQNYEDFMKRAIANLKAERRHQKRYLHVQQEIGTLVESTFVETLTKRGKKKDMWECVIRVPRTKTWCVDGLSSMHCATLKVMVAGEHAVDPETGLKHWTELKEDKSHNWLKAVVYDINQEPEDNDHCKVSVLTSLKYGEKLEGGTQIKIIPKPPVGEKAAMRKGLKKWKEFLEQRERGVKSHVGLIKRATFHANVDWTQEEPKSSVHRVSFKLAEADEAFWASITKRLNSCYVGSNICLQKKEKVLTARVMAIENREEHVELDCCVVGNVDKDDLDLGNICELKLWVVSGKAGSAEGKVCNVLPAGFHDEDDNEYLLEDGNFEDEDEEEASEKEEQAEPQVNQLLPLPFNEYHCKKGINTSTETLSDLLNNWIEEPVVDLGVLDVLLTKNNKVKHHVPLTRKSNNNFRWQHKVDRASNKDQAQAISKMMSNRVSIVSGPPGTGKTTCGANGVIKLFNEEGGLILVTAPSNFACDAFYDKLKEANTKYNVGMKIIRVESEARERKWWKQHRNEEDQDPGRLHVAMRNHPKWNPRKTDGTVDTKTLELMHLMDDHPAIVPSESRKMIANHKSKIRSEILKSADVVVSTVSCAVDGRIESILTTRNGGRRQISGVVLDEASVMTVPSLVPLMALGSRRLWVLGDTNQLKPTVLNQSAVIGGLDVSFMEMQFLNTYIQKHDLNTLLKTQYRMAVPICNIVSQYCYNGLLETAEVVKKRNYSSEDFPDYPEVGKDNVGVFTYDGYQERVLEGTHSSYNQAEIKIITHILRNIAKKDPKLTGVVILTMYDSQKGKLEKELQQMGENFKDVKVAVVDSFQGKESDVVVLSFVRSNAEFHVGFLREHQRINVGISRAKHNLFLVIDVKTFGNTGLPNVRSFVSTLETNKVSVRERKFNGKSPVDFGPVPMDIYMEQIKKNGNAKGKRY